ncbi:unnamed protein product [Blepharisma stoltei]|uniref:SSD domain-containing protein n=1 Tax=Blepharisma stoltei TaxID=1481888 RepID=A0AAU9IE21_9CILI|nr:unnamed protein product [Blepharisma stoltei]
MFVDLISFQLLNIPKESVAKMVLAAFFYNLGKFNAKHPILVICLSLLATIIFSIGFIFLDVQTNPQKLWVDPGSRSNHEQNYFEDKFGKFYRVEQAIFSHRTDPEHTDVFQKEFLAELWEVQSRIENAEILYDNSLHTVDSFCYKPVHGKGCFISSPMDYWKMNITQLESDNDIKLTAQCINQIEGQQILCSDRNNIPIIRNLTFGGISCEDGTQGTCQACKIKAKALIITFLLNNNDETKDMGVENWEKHVFEKYMKDFNDDNTKQLKVAYYSERSVPDELDKEDSQNFIYVVISYLCMFLYVSMAIGTFPSRLHTRFMVGLSGVICVICSVCISIGITSYAGIPLSMISIEVVPFLILAIGVDNMFIISMGESKERDILKKKGIKDHAEIMGCALREVAPTITAAAFSECAAFMVGATTNVPALTNFCITAAIAVLADYFLQITAFVAVIELDYRRWTGRRIDCFPCFDLEKSVKEPRRRLVKKFVKKIYAPVIFHPITQVCLAITFVSLFILSFGSYDDINLGLTEQVTCIHKSDLYKYFDSYDDYLQTGAIAYLVFKDINYTNPTNQQLLSQMSDALSQMSKTVQPPVYSWVKALNSYINDVEPECNNSQVASFDFNTQVRLFLTVSIDSICCKKFGVCGEQYETDIIFDDDGEIKASRFRFQHTALKDQSDYIDALRDTRYAVDTIGAGLVPNMKTNPSMSNYQLRLSQEWIDTTDSYTSDERLAFSYSLFYVFYDQYRTIRGVAVQNLFLAFAAIILAIELLTNIYAALLVTLMVAGTSWGLIGFLYIWNELAGGYKTEINAVSVVNLVMCCGLAVEFSIHIMTSFLKFTGTRKERARKALVDMGSVVMTGIASTKLIGVIVLGLAPSLVFNLYYFRMYFGMFCLGFFHGLAFQPVLLMYIGPPSTSTEEPKKINGYDSKIDGTSLKELS